MKARLILATVVLVCFSLAGCERGVAISAYNLSDQNWTLGVGKKWAGFFVKFSPDLEKEFAVGRELIFADGSTRKIIRQEHAGEFLNIYVDGAILDGNAVGYPKAIKFAKP